MPRKPPYALGDWFAIPLGDGSFLPARVARWDGRNTIAAYLFAPAVTAPPPLSMLQGVTAAGAFSYIILSDLGLRRGEWPVIGGAGDFVGRDWPIGEFERVIDVPGREAVHEAVRYADDNPNHALSVRRLSHAEWDRLPIDGLSGYQAAVVHARHRLGLLGLGSPVAPDDFAPVPGLHVAPTPADPVVAPTSPDRDAVIVRLDTRDVGDPGGIVDKLQDTLERVVRESGAGEYDGLVRNEEETTLYLYGDDAAHLWRVVSATLAALPPAVRVEATARTGDTERRLAWPVS